MGSGWGPGWSWLQGNEWASVSRMGAQTEREPGHQTFPERLGLRELAGRSAPASAPAHLGQGPIPAAPPFSNPARRLGAGHRAPGERGVKGERA